MRGMKIFSLCRGRFYKICRQTFRQRNFNTLIMSAVMLCLKLYVIGKINNYKLSSAIVKYTSLLSVCKMKLFYLIITLCYYGHEDTAL